MTYWVDNHPGGAYAIQKWSENNGTTLVFPSLSQSNPHSMSRWNNNWQKFTYVGRFGDFLEIGDLPKSLKLVEVSKFFDNQSGSNDANVMVCGSPGEVNNDKSDDLIYDAHTGFDTVHSTRGYNKIYNKHYVWFMIALEASDQLRQRVAWAFAQILVIVKSAEIGETEGFLYFYDIFVRNAFGNYRDILREVSYNTYMAETLTFIGSKSSAYMLERYRIKASAGKLLRYKYMNTRDSYFTELTTLLTMDNALK